MEEVLDRVNALLERVAVAHEAGKLAAAERLAVKALTLAEAELGANDPNLAPILTTLARLRTDRGDEDGAIPLLGRAAKLLTKLRKDPEAAGIEIDARRALGMAFLHKANYRAADRELQHSVTLAEKTYGKQHIEVARGLNALGMLCKYTGRFVEGRLFYKRALVVATRAAGADSEDVAVIYHNIGGIEHAAGRYQHAEGPARLGVTIREKLLGPDHPSVAEDVAALAAILDGQERFAESGPMYERVLPLFRARRAHYDVAVNLHNLAAAHAAQHKFASAQKMYREAEKLKQKLLGDDHPDTALTAYCIGVLARARGDHDEALARIGRAERVFHKTLGMAHPHTVEARRTLAALKKHGPKGGQKSGQKNEKTRAARTA